MGEEHVELRCDCGEQLSCSRTTDRVRCECGARYAVTITKLIAAREI